MEYETQKFSSFMPNSNTPEEFDRCKKKFVESFVVYTQCIYTSANSQQAKYKLREDLFKIKSLVVTTSFVFSGRSLSATRPDRFEKCARSTKCVRYHMLDIEDVYKKLIEGSGTYTCPECGTKAVQPKQIVPDYISYLYYIVTDGTQISIILKREALNEITQDQHSEIYASENRVIVADSTAKLKTIVTFHFENYSSSFRNIITNLQNKHLLETYTTIRNEENMKSITLSQAVRDNNVLANLNTTSFSIVSLITGKRMKSGVLHGDCRHSQRIYVFDLEGLLLSFVPYHNDKKIVQPQSSVKCIYCDSEFTAENILRKAVFFGKVNSIITKFPFACGRAYFDTNNLQAKAEEDIIRPKQRLKQNNKNEIDDKKLERGYRDLNNRAVAFWNNQNRRMNQQRLLQTLKSIKNIRGNCYSKAIDYRKMFYPVRCKKCESLDFVDLWDELVHIVELIQLETTNNDRCLTCKEYTFENNPQLDIYLDVQVYTLMQYSLLNIAYYPSLRRWLPDIRGIKFREGVDTDPIEFIILFLRLNNKYSSNNSLPYYRNPFKVEHEFTNNTECFILDECMGYNSNSMNNLHEHLIFAEKSQEYTLKCPKCSKVPQSILSLNYDYNLGINIRREFNEWNSILKQFQKGFKKPVEPKPEEPKKEETKTGKGWVAQNELLWMQEMFAQEYKKLPKHFYKDKEKAWNIDEIKEYAGGVYIFTGAHFDMLRVA